MVLVCESEKFWEISVTGSLEKGKTAGKEMSADGHAESDRNLKSLKASRDKRV